MTAESLERTSPKPAFLVPKVLNFRIKLKFIFCKAPHRFEWGKKIFFIGGTSLPQGKILFVKIQGANYCRSNNTINRTDVVELPDQLKPPQHKSGPHNQDSGTGPLQPLSSLSVSGQLCSSLGLLLLKINKGSFPPTCPHPYCHGPHPPRLPTSQPPSNPPH